MIENLSKRTLEVADLSKTLLEHFQAHRIDWMHACGGKGRCTTCKVIVTQGLENFEALTPAEARYRQQGALSNNERLSCQSRIAGDVSIIVPEESQFPHIEYSLEK